MAIEENIKDDFVDVHKYIHELEKRIYFYNKKVKSLSKEIKKLAMENQAYKDSLKSRGVLHES